MRKILSLFIAVLMLLTASSCSSRSKNGSEADIGAGIERAAPLNSPVETAPYVIEYYMLANSASYEVDYIMDEINKIILPKLNATVNITMVTWDEWFVKTNGDIRAGEKVDIVFTADWWQYMDSIASGYFLPLDDLLDQHGSAARGLLGETFISGCQVDGILYGVPTNKELAVNGGFVYNKTLLDKYGLEVDTEWKSLSDWEPLLKVIKENEPDVVPVLTDGRWNHLHIVTNLPCELVFGSKEGDAAAGWLYDYPWYMDELRTVRDFYLKGYIPEESLSSVENEWVNNRIAQGNFFLLTEALKPGKGKSTELMATLAHPGIEYDEFETYPLMVSTRHSGGSMLAIPVTSEDPAKAMQFINEMHTNPVLTNLLAWGIEGRQYTVVGENPKRVKPMENDSWIPAVLVWALGNQFLVHLSDIEPEDKYTLMAATKEGVPEHISNGFRFNVSDLQDKITAINSIHEEYRVPIRIGLIDPDEGVASMRAKLDEVGFGELKAAVIAEFEKWLADNR